MRNTLHYGDCLNVMADFPDKCVDLIYLDPPFNSKTNYNLLFPNPDSKEKIKSEQPHLAQIIAFHDTWTWDGPAAERVKRIENAVAHPAHKAIKGLSVMLGESGAMAYLSYMAERLGEIKRLLKPTGSIYLHCDPTMSHYLKALMDEIFGYQNFRNEIIWKRFGSHNDAKKGFGNIHDVLLFYAGGPKAKFQKTYQPYTKEYIKSAYPYKDKRGRYGTSPLQARSLSGGGYDYTYKGVSDIWKFPKKRLEELDRDGYIHWPKNGKIPRRKVYLHLMKGAPTQDVITDINPLSSSHKERLGLSYAKAD